MAAQISQWHDAVPAVRGCVLAHRKELVEQNHAKLESYFTDCPIGIFSAGLGRRDYDAQILFASIDSIFKKSGEFPAFDFIFVDECFPAGTPIAMVSGDWKSIEDVITGDAVLNATGRGVVTETSHTITTELVTVRLSNGRSFRCTKRHPVFTSSGWKNAGDLEQWERVACVQDMPGLWRNLRSLEEDGRREDRCTVQGKSLQEALVLQRLLREESGEPNARPGGEGKDAAVAPANWAQAERERRQRQRDDRPATGTDELSVVGAGMDTGTCRANANEALGRLSVPLQDRPRESTQDASNRGGREFALREEATIGREEGGSSGWARVESVASEQLESPLVVYNFGVSGHPSYFANDVLVHNCHRIPPSGDGKYRQFIQGCQAINPKLRVVGWTATPFRMGCGPICHKDHILHEVCYSAGITELIGDGFLSQLRTKVSPIKADLSGVKRNSGGDYVVKQLSAAACKGDLVAAAVARALELLAIKKRKSAIFFCIDVEHCRKVSAELARHGIDAPAITGKTKIVERDRITANFKAKRLNAVCCVNVLTEGFDAPHIDAIILLRSTLSPGLFAQMVGRGLRIDPGKDYCLVLDFAGCIDEHGPIDLLGQHDKVVLAVCPECEEAFSRAARKCPECGWAIPKIKVEQLEREEAERRMHAANPSGRSILSNVPEVFAVDSIILSVHQKSGSPNSLKVRYRCGLRFFTEWICLEHMNYARAKASKWWTARFGLSGKLPTVADAVNDMFLPQRLTDWTKTVTVQREGKYFRVIDYNAAIEKEEKDAT